MASTVVEVSWIIGLFRELDMPIVLPIVIYSDSTAAIQIASNPVFHERTKHIDIDCHFIREKIQKGIIQTEHVRTDHQLADILTKGLGHTQHDFLLSKLGVFNLFHTTKLERGCEDEGC